MFGHQIFAYQLVKQEMERRQQLAQRARTARRQARHEPRQMTLKIGGTSVTIRREAAHAGGSL